MEAVEQIKKIEEFIESNYLKELMRAASHGERSLIIDFIELSKFDPGLADMLLDQPEEVLKASELAVANFDLPGDAGPIKIRINNLPSELKVLIRNIRAEHLSRLLMIEGTVRQKSDVRPQVISARFECPSCGNILNVLQLDSKFKEPTRCGCGRKGKFRLLSKELVDAQGIVLEESTKDLEGGEQPKRMNVLLKDDLVSPISEKKTNPGSSIRVFGIVKEVPIILRTGGQSTKFDLIIEANYVEALEEDYTNIEISKEEEKQIVELSKDKRLQEKLIRSLAPGIYGHDRIKEAMLLQFVGGVRKSRSDGVNTRGDIHILLIGDPGSGKSMLLKRAAVVAPKARYVSGKGVSGAGLCVAPDSMIMTNPGGMHKIKNIVEDRFENNKRVTQGAWKKDNINDVKILSLSHDLKLQTKYPESIWKLRAPEKVYKITLLSGKKIELTGNTQLLSIEDGRTLWKKSSNVAIGDFIATPRRLIGGNIEKQYTVDIIKSNPVIHDIKPFVKEITEKLAEKFGSIRKAAKALNISENNLYHNWVNEKARGNIKLNALKKICEETGENWKEKVKKISLYNGKNHLIPTYLSKDFLYVAGLIAGDGNIRKNNNTISIRLDNSEPALQDIFKNVLKKEFNLKFDIQKGSKNRPESTRTHSKILGEILMSLGIIFSPKSADISMSNTLLHMTNELLAHYIAGLYDADGSIHARDTKGSGCIQLTTCSEKLARQLQLVLLRFSIQTKLRSRKPTTGKIKGRHTRYCVEIRGFDRIKKFSHAINLRHPEKVKRLSKILKKSLKSNTNLDVVPGMHKRLKRLMELQKIATRKYNLYHNLSRQHLQNILSKIDCDGISDIDRIAHADIFWDRIVEISQINPVYDYVYDLTVRDSHNFVVDGILVHNTASVVKDEFLSGWSLEAGALVLANRGVVMIDELDKMSKEDRAAMHEGLEQQSYHHDFEIMFSDGTTEKIGKFVDKYFKNNKKSIIKGKDCEIMDISTEKLLTTDFHKITRTVPARISRHKAPKHYYRITFSNGRSIIVTPEHPVFVYKNNRNMEILASSAKKGMIVPSVRLLPVIGEKQLLQCTEIRIHNNKKIVFPKFLDSRLARLLGYIASNGHSYFSKKNSYADIGVSNTDKNIIDECNRLFSGIFSASINIKLSPMKKMSKATKDQYVVRCSSKPLYEFFIENFPEIIKKAPEKRIPAKLKKARKAEKTAFLCSFFKGDGFVESERAGFSTSSEKLAWDLQDMLLSIGICSYVAREKRGNRHYYKVVVSEKDCLERFCNHILKNDHRKERVMHFLDKSRSRNRRNATDYIPHELLLGFNDLLKKVDCSDGYFTTLIKRRQYPHKKVVIEYLKKAKEKVKLDRYKQFAKETDDFEKLFTSDIKYIKITDIKKVEDKRYKWVYDVTVEPTRTFISHGLVLHNTISISKANIQATLRCETTVLAAANPKFGRFDPYETIARQIDLPPTLINRFDLIFTIKDLPDEDKDEKMAGFILNLHQSPDIEEAEIDTELLRKYLVYCRQRLSPLLTDSAIKELKDYYIKMRTSGSMEEGGVKTIPISARQLEALVRLSEASAKLRLSNKVTKKDARQAIALLHYCLEQVGLDPETGKIDIDRITTGIPTTERSKIISVREIINELEEKVGKTIPIEEITSLANERGISEDDVDEAIQKLKISGDLFEPRRGFISKI